MAFSKTSYPQYSEFIHLSRYSRWREDLKRRETWEETVTRLTDFWKNRYPEHTDTINKIHDAIYNLEIMPSMRSLMTAGVALERDNVAGYNCAYAAIQGDGEVLEIYTEDMERLGFIDPIRLTLKNPIVIDEIMYILLCGTGVGFSVERQFINDLPTIGKPLDRGIYEINKTNYLGVDSHELSFFDSRSSTIRVADSKYGWASALRILITELYNGNFDVEWDTSKVRPKGSPLKTFGGRASGPEPLNDLFSYCVNLFKSANGRKLSSIEAHGLICKIASVVVVGGVRRSALISLSNLSDERMRAAKTGQWWISNPEYALANNSVAYTEKPDIEIFIKEWLSLIESKSGERGIFNREAARNVAGASGRRNISYDFGINPCSEIVLRSKQFCNLTECVIREYDTLQSLKRKIELATVLGTFQASLTDFKYLSPEWKKNTEEEALLGVSLTGIMDHKILSGREDMDDLWGESYYNVKRYLRELKEVAIETNREWAEKLGINQAAAITCVKPSGTVSQLVDSASGIHTRYSKYYIRAVRNDAKDPLSMVMINQGIPYELDEHNPNSYVFYFPIKAPENAVTRNDLNAIEQLELWKTYQLYWCEHKPSITVFVDEHEWLEVATWVYENFDLVSGIAFLPKDKHIYVQAPYQEITEEEYLQRLSEMPSNIDWSLLTLYEKMDETKGSQEYACTGNACEIL